MDLFVKSMGGFIVSLFVMIMVFDFFDDHFVPSFLCSIFIGGLIAYYEAKKA